MKPTEIKKELDENQVVLLVVPSIEYNEAISNVMQQLSGKSVCYVTLNKTFSSLEELFKKKKIELDSVVFIDAISKTIKQTPAQTDKCYFVSSPSALTELSLTMTKFLKHNFEYLVFDSLTTMNIYENKGPIVKFMSSIINKIKETETKAVFLASNIKDQEEIIKQIATFVDKVVEID